MAENIWVIQTAFLGDCVLSLPFIFQLAELHPRARIHIVTSKGGYDIFHLALQRGLASESSRISLHLFEKRGRHKGILSAWRFSKQIQKFSGGAPETVYCLQRSARTGLMALFSGARQRVGFSSGAASYFYTHLAPREWNSGKSEIEKNFDLLKVIEGAHKVRPWSPQKAPSLLRSQKRIHAKTDRAERRDYSTRTRRVALALGSPWPTKRWPIENAATLANKLTAEGIEVHLVGDERSRELSFQLKSQCPSLLIKDHVGITNLEDWVDIIDICDVIVCNDSAATHVASDLGRKCITLFGPTLPEFGFAPWRSPSVALGLDQLYCRPCHIHGPKKCPEGHHRCLKELSGELVFKQVFKMLQMS